jgi:exodeoxyribonuclease VII large subunit
VIGVATSQSGAALQDILKVASRRGRVKILIANCAVQGPQAPPQIVQAIERLAPHVDVMIVGRGGGSVADLWCFNDEQVARAIFRCPVPVVSAVGHEVDFTIADFVADVRAPTPSAAAELCVPEFARLVSDLDGLSQRLLRGGRRVIDGARQQLDGALGRSQLALERQLSQRRRMLDQLGQRLQARHPRTQLQRDHGSLDKLHGRLLQAMDRQLSDRRRALDSTVGQGDERLLAALSRLVASKRQVLLATMGKLEALSPLKVLTRGYAVARDEAGRVLTDAKSVAVGDGLSVTLQHGVLFCKVESRQDKSPQNFEIPKASKN